MISVRKQICKWIEENSGEFTNRDVRDALGIPQPPVGKNDCVGIEISWMCQEKKLERRGFRGGFRLYRKNAKFDGDFIARKQPPPPRPLPQGVLGIYVHRLEG